MMAGLKVPKDLNAEQYIAIEDSLLSSESGRAFLRMRDRKSAVLAMDEFHSAVRSIRGWFEAASEKSVEDTHLTVLRHELMEMAASIRKAKIEISAMKPAENAASSKRINLATEELDAIVHATERATSDILNSAERVLETAAKVRKHDLADEAAELESEATNILVSCGFQDITGQRISKVVATLRYLEERVDAMIRIWGLEGVKSEDIPSGTLDTRADAHLLNGPALRDGIDQSAVDSMFDTPATHGHDAPADDLAWPDMEPAAAAPAPAPPPPPAPPAPVKAEKPEKAEKKAEPKAPAPPPPEITAEQGAAVMDQSSIDSLFP
jgi:chemotaxis regulatin CheY-phosphate phosphatase CheZ